MGEGTARKEEEEDGKVEEREEVGAEDAVSWAQAEVSSMGDDAVGIDMWWAGSVVVVGMGIGVRMGIAAAFVVVDG